MPDGRTKADIATIERRLKRQIESWVAEMIQITPIAQWDAELADLLDDWADNYGVRFTRQSVDAVMRWIALEQQLALAEEGPSPGGSRHQPHGAAVEQPSKQQEDKPKSATAGDENLDRYVGNGPLRTVDPAGLQATAIGPAPPGYVSPILPLVAAWNSWRYNWRLRGSFLVHPMRTTWEKVGSGTLDSLHCEPWSGSTKSYSRMIFVGPQVY